jgi:predicted nucleotidyltransferase
LEILEELKEKIKDVFSDIPVKSLYIFGSLVKEGCFASFSDIDMAVEGLDTRYYFEAYTRLEETFSRNIDLVELERCKTRKIIEQNGLKLI